MYKAYDLKLDRPVALKLLPRHITVDAERLRRSRLEARAASSLNHPNILVVHDFGEEGGRPFMVTEYVEGQTLRDRLDHGAMPIVELIHVAVQIASALAAAHERGVLHRDIKPENVMLRPDGYVKVLDFGLAKLVTANESVTAGHTETAVGIIMGTPRYMSPEQARGERVTFQSDQFSFGILLYELATGRSPFQRASAIETAAAVITAQAESLGEPVHECRLRSVTSSSDAWQRTRADGTRRRGILHGSPDRSERVERWTRVGRDAAARRTARAGGQREPVAPPVRSAGCHRAAGEKPHRDRDPHMRVAVVFGCRIVGDVSAARLVQLLPSVAVLPFNTIGGGGEYFADGLTKHSQQSLERCKGCG